MITHKNNILEKRKANYSKDAYREMIYIVIRIGPTIVAIRLAIRAFFEAFNAP
jgi:hypothetical protein